MEKEKHELTEAIETGKIVDDNKGMSSYCLIYA